MIHQLIFLLFLLAMGLALMFFFKGRIRRLDFFILSFPMGLALWNAVLLAVFLLGLSLRVFPLAVSGLFIAASVYRHVRKRVFTRLDVKPVLVFFICFSITASACVLFNYSFFTNDSWRMLIGSQSLLASNQLPESLVAATGLSSYLIHTSSGIFGFEYVYAIFPLMTILFFIFFATNLYSPFEMRKITLNREFLFSLVSTLFLLSCFFILLNANYIHFNLLFGFYSFIAVFGIWKRLVCGENSWLFLSTLCTLTASFLRLEGLFVSLIILIILIGRDNIEARAKLWYLGVVIFFVCAWQVKLYTLLLGHEGRFTRYYLSTPRLALIIAAYIAVLLAFLFSKKGFFSSYKEFFPLMMLYVLSFAWTYQILTSGFKFSRKVLVLRRYWDFIQNTVRDGGWGITWIFLGTLFVLALLMKRLKFESIFVLYIFSYMLLYNVLHLFRRGWRPGWGDSGNRTLIQVLFIMAFYVFFKLKESFIQAPEGRDR